MSIENARLVYPVLVRAARELSRCVRERKSVNWMSYDDFCRVAKEMGLKESPRTIASKLLRPLQAACLEHQLPDLSAIVIQKPKSRGDFGSLIRPGDLWWEPYAARGEAVVGDIKFWFERYKAARDYEAWPEAPFF